MEAIVADTTHAFGRHMHDQYGIGVILRGAQKSWSGRGMVQAQAGDVITVNPGEVHDGLPLGEHGRAWRMLYFDPAVLGDVITTVTEGVADSAGLSHPTMRNPPLARRFLSLFRAMTDPQGGHSEIEISEHLILLLAGLIAHGQEKRPRVDLYGINQARARIDEDPSLALSLAELAAISGISPFQLVRGFSKGTGLTPHAYLIQRRLQRARRLIARGTSLTDAAQLAGFSDQSHMTRLFVRTYGISPGRYATVAG